MADSQLSNTMVNDESIRELAQQKWQEAGRPPGDGTDFWYAAERELKERGPETEKAGSSLASPGST